MSIERKCVNCRNDETNSCDYCKNFNHFEPKEELVRQDERNKIVDILGMDLEEAKKVLAETLKSIDKEQLYKDLVSSRLLVEKEK